MIARIWHGRVPASKSDAYYAYLLQTGMQEYAATPGNKGVQVLRKTEDGVTHFLLVTLWDSVDAIKRFAGEDYGAQNTTLRTTNLCSSEKYACGTSRCSPTSPTLARHGGCLKGSPSRCDRSHGTSRAGFGARAWPYESRPW